MRIYGSSLAWVPHTSPANSLTVIDDFSIRKAAGNIDTASSFLKISDVFLCENLPGDKDAHMRVRIYVSNEKERVSLGRVYHQNIIWPVAYCRYPAKLG